MAEHAKQSIQEYAQHNSAMGGSRGSQGIQYGRSQTPSTTTRYMFAEHRAHLSQSWNEEVLRLVDHALLMCEMVDTSTSRYERMLCAAAIKKTMEKPQERL